MHANKKINNIIETLTALNQSITKVEGAEILEHNHKIELVHQIQKIIEFAYKSNGYGNSKFINFQKNWIGPFNTIKIKAFLEQEIETFKNYNEVSEENSGKYYDDLIDRIEKMFIK